MDVPLVLNDIEICKRLKRYIRKSSTFSHQTDVVGFLRYIWLILFIRTLKEVNNDYLGLKYVING